MPRRNEDEEEEELWDEEPEEDEEEDDEEEEEEEGGTDLDEVVAEGEDLAERGELRKALRLWRKNIDRFADEPVAFYQLALAIFRVLEEAVATHEIWQSDSDLVGLYEEALSNVEESLAMDEEHVDSWNLLGALQALRENHKEAAAAWERSLELQPNQRQVKADLKRVKQNLDEDE